MYSKILVPIDTTYDSDAWLKAPLTVAHEMVRKSKGVIHIVSVIPKNLLRGYYPDLYTDAVANDIQKKLQAIIERYCPADAAVETIVEEGNICSRILAVARELPADLIVMASHGPLIKDYLLGSNATHVALRAPCSVFIVREDPET